MYMIDVIILFLLLIYCIYNEYTILTHPPIVYCIDDNNKIGILIRFLNTALYPSKTCCNLKLSVFKAYWIGCDIMNC